MSVILTILFVFSALLLIAVILVQQPKTSGGLFAGTGQSLLGTSGKTFWTKTTIALAAFVMLLCIILSVMPKFEKPATVTDIIDQQQKAAQAPAVAAPAVPSPVSANPAPQSVPAAAQPVVPSANTSSK